MHIAIVTKCELPNVCNRWLIWSRGTRLDFRNLNSVTPKCGWSAYAIEHLLNIWWIILYKVVRDTDRVAHLQTNVRRPSFLERGMPTRMRYLSQNRRFPRENFLPVFFSCRSINIINSRAMRQGYTFYYLSDPRMLKIQILKLTA